MPYSHPQPFEKGLAFQQIRHLLPGALVLTGTAGFSNSVVLGFFHTPVSHMTGAVSQPPRTGSFPEKQPFSGPRGNAGLHSRTEWGSVTARMTSASPLADTIIPGGGSKPALELIQATRPYAVEDPGKSWWCLLSTTALWLAAMAGTVWNFHLVGQVFCSLLAGLLLLRLFVIYHDQQHHAILSKSRLAERLMRVFGIYALSPSSIWRSSHNHHHKHNSKIKGAHIGSFPIMTKAHYLNTPRATRWLYLFVRHPLTILLGYVFVFLQGMCLLPFLRKPREHFDCLLSLLVHFGITVALIFSLNWSGVVLTQTLPHLVAFGLGSYLFYAQHNFPGVAFHDKCGWTYERAALESSSYMKMSPLMAWFTGNIGYHHIHHLNARIPFYRLPEVLAAFPELQRAQTTSLNPREVLRCLRLKVWDVEQQRMVGLPKANG